MSSTDKKGGKEPAGFKGRRRPLKKPLKKASGVQGKAKLEEFYCPGCKDKRVKVPLKNISLKKTSNGRDMAVGKCSLKNCKRTGALHKFISKADAERLQKLKK